MDNRSANQVDLHVGAVIRARRRAAGLSQHQLAAACEISFQQVQKYENGANRVSASRLAQIAAKLGATAADFFPDAAAPGGQANAAFGELCRVISRPGGAELVGALRDMDDQRFASVCNVASAIAGKWPDGGGAHVA